MRKIDLTNFQVARSETARDINRRIVLNLIRTHQPVSRADLSRRSGLQRSTVSAITEELITDRWVSVGEQGSLPRGRKPTFLHLNSTRAGIIGVDLRPSRTNIALADLAGNFVAQESILTGHDPDRFLATLKARLRELMRAHPETVFEGIGLSLPGRVDLETRRLVFAPNLGWTDLDLITPLEEATGLSVEAENAANACALAELWSGRYGEGVRDLIAVTVSEGIGVGMVLNGQLVRGQNGLAGEFGHVCLRENGPLCRCGRCGCWEACASNSAAVRYHREAANPGDPDQTADFEAILRMAEQGDRPATKALERMARDLGAGIAMLITGFAPHVVVLLGEITRAWDRVGPIIDEVVKHRLPTRATSRIVPTNPGSQPRLRGTILLVLLKHFGAPMVA